MAKPSTRKAPPANIVRPPMLAESTFWLSAIVLLSVSALCVYARVLTAPFIFDDRTSVKENPSIVRLWPPMGTTELPGPLNPPKDLPTAGRPLVNLSLAFNYFLGRFNPLGYHAFNLAIHFLSALLLFAIVRRTLRLEFFGGRFDDVAPWLALGVALVWMVHPLQTEAVAYITQRTELLMGFCYLATLYCSLRYWTNGDVARNRWLVLASLACMAGMACKEVMVTAPFVVLLFERTFITGSFRRALRRSWPLYVGLVFSWALLLALNYAAPRSRSAGFHLGVAATDWWFTQSEVFWLYLKLAVWPWPLAIHYELPYLTSFVAAAPWLLPAIALAIGSAILLRRRNPIGFVGAWVILILLPTLIVPITTEVAAERRMYLPLAAIVTLLVAGGYSLAQKMAGPRRAWFIVAVAGLIIVLSFVSVNRLGAYHDEITLWQNTVAARPNDPLALNNLADALNRAGRPQEALQPCELALQIDPHNAKTELTLGNILSALARPNEAIEHYHRAMQIRADDADTLNNLGMALMDTGQTAQAIEQFRQAARLKPTDADINYNLGNSFLATGKLPEAVASLQRAVQLQPDNAEIHNNLAAALAQSGRMPEAVDEFEQTLSLQPIARHYFNLARAYAKLQRADQAVAAAESGFELASREQQTVLAQQIKKWLDDFLASQSTNSDPTRNPPANSSAP